jgi:FKBP-type peptidyl-prolyl cis-trans isomerase SlyD
VEVIGPNACAVIEFVLSDDEGEEIDRSDPEGVTYVHGYGMLVPGLEAGLSGMRAGERKRIPVTSEEGFGDRDEELVMELARDELPNPKAVEVGDEVVAESPEGDEAVLRVVEVLADAVIVDGNHPLAGVGLVYDVMVRSVRAATVDEIEAAARELAVAEDELFGSEPEVSGAGPQGLVQLGVRKSK